MGQTLESNSPTNNQPETHRNDGRKRSGRRAAPYVCMITIGSIVLPMPEKTHRCTRESYSGFELLLELFRRLVAER